MVFAACGAFEVFILSRKDKSQSYSNYTLIYQVPSIPCGIVIQRGAGRVRVMCAARCAAGDSSVAGRGGGGI